MTVYIRENNDLEEKIKKSINSSRYLKFDEKNRCIIFLDNKEDVQNQIEFLKKDIAKIQDLHKSLEISEPKKQKKDNSLLKIPFYLISELKILILKR